MHNMWEEINNFLNRTDLTARDEIIIAVIVSFLIPGIIVSIKTFVFNPIRKRISKLKEEKARDKRLRDGTFTLPDILRIRDKDESELKDYELQAIEKAEQDLRELNRSRDEEMQVILDSIKELDDFD